MESRFIKFFFEICLALEAIHEKGIVHADLKPCNFLLSGTDMVIKLTDFGISQIMSSGYNFLYEHACTLPYASPEVLQGQRYNSKTDIWGLGCIIYEMIAGKQAYGYPNE